LKINQLRAVLELVESDYRNQKNFEYANGISSFAANLLNGKGDEPVASFVKRLEKARLSANARATEMAKPPKRKSNRRAVEK
jgi:hypothetical protein